jgi:hypothetical protein
MPSDAISTPQKLIVFTGLAAFFGMPCSDLSAAPPAFNAPTAAAHTQSAVFPTQFKRQPFPGGDLFKTPQNPSGWNISLQPGQPDAPRAKKFPTIANIHVITDRSNNFQAFEFSDGRKVETWTISGLRVISDPGSSIAAVSDSTESQAEIESLWDTEAISGWTGMQELSWIKPEHFLSAYQGQESRYHIFVEEYTPQESQPSPTPPPAGNKTKVPAPQSAEQKYPQGMIPGVPLKPMIRAALIDVNTLLPKRVQLGLTTLIYTYDAKPTPIVLPPKVTAILPASNAQDVKSKNTNVSSIPIP